MKKINQKIILYTAGFVDGEGSIQINPAKSGKKSYWGLTIQTTNSDKDVLEYLRNEWGGIGTVTGYKPNKSKNRSYNWRIYSKEAELFLNKLFPYLIIKKEEARLALEFRKLTGFKRGQLTETISKKRTKIAMRLREIHRTIGKAKSINNKINKEVL